MITNLTENKKEKMCKYKPSKIDKSCSTLGVHVEFYKQHEASPKKNKTKTSWFGPPAKKN